MKRYNPILIVVLILISQFGIAQVKWNEVMVVDSMGINQERYEMARSPYLFTEFVPATLTDKNRGITKDLPINYNGLTKSFECEFEGRTVELDPRFYIRVEVITDKLNELVDENPDQADTVLFMRALHPDHLDDFYIKIFGGLEITLFKELTIEMMDANRLNVSYTMKFAEIETSNRNKHAIPQFHYWTLMNGEVSEIYLNKKSILSKIGNTSEIRAYIKQNDLNLTTEKDLLQLVRFYDAL